MTPSSDKTALHACMKACLAIAPSWPLDESVSINPHINRIDLPVTRVAAKMTALGGIHVYPQREFFSKAWLEKRITTEDLRQAIQIQKERGVNISIKTCLAALQETNQSKKVPSLANLVQQDLRRPSRLALCEEITNQISQTCAAFFSANKGNVGSHLAGSLYQFWRESISSDTGLSLRTGLLFSALANHLPPYAPDVPWQLLQQLDLAENIWPEYFESSLLSIQGWASWCAYLNTLDNAGDFYNSELFELLCIRLAWDLLLLMACNKESERIEILNTLRNAWGQLPELLAQYESHHEIDETWLLALEHRYQSSLFSQISATDHSNEASCCADIAAVFCMDTRSESMRRCLEHELPGLNTIGVAGFFGVPIAYRSTDTGMAKQHVPVTSQASVEAINITRRKGETTNVLPDTGLVDNPFKKHQLLNAIKQPWSSWSHRPLTAFTQVEAIGTGYLPKLLRLIKPGLPLFSSKQGSTIQQPTLTGVSIQEQAQIATNIMKCLSIKLPFPKLVVLVGHSSQSTNNAHASVLNCGACRGQSGLVNARIAAQLLNDRLVRKKLSAQGIKVAPDVYFIAAEHNTTTESLLLYDTDLIPASHKDLCDKFESAAQAASISVRQQRQNNEDAITAASSPEDLEKQFLTRALDPALTRPEFGLSNNAALILAPRLRSREIDLHRRAFLLDYDARTDTAGEALESLMNGPMVVAHMINWQYFSSTIEPDKFGSGNKLLHNVVGGNIGVFEGSGGDLRIGLAKQSLHDGNKWLHEPIRLTVFIDATQESIEKVLNDHKQLAMLVHNRWLSIWYPDCTGNIVRLA